MSRDFPGLNAVYMNDSRTFRPYLRNKDLVLQRPKCYCLRTRYCEDMILNLSNFNKLSFTYKKDTCMNFVFVKFCVELSISFNNFWIFGWATLFYVALLGPSI